MLKHIRQNPTIAAGILLPLLVAALFVLATAVPRMLVAAPEYDLLFTVSDYRQGPYPVEVRFDVDDGKLRARAYNAANNYRNVPVLYRYEHATNTVRRIDVDLAAGTEEFADGTELDIPDLAGVGVSSATQAPDGYEMTTPGYRRDGLMGLFFGRRHDSGIAIRKDGAVYAIPSVDGRHFYYGNVTFVGWIVGFND